MRRSDDPAPGAYDDYYIASTLRSESSTLRLDRPIPFPPHAIRQSMTLSRKRFRTHQIDHRLASRFVEAIIFDEGDAVQGATGHESGCRAHDNLNAIPHAASVADKAAA